MLVERESKMTKPIISFDDIELTPVQVQKTKWDRKNEKSVDLKTPIINRSKTTETTCYDLVDFIETIRFHLNDKVDISWRDEDYLEVKMKVRHSF
tara:strand:+ start:752 stop:1036 length:285 start_codon:yes stop_codon:yes gene_type:complete